MKRHNEIKEFKERWDRFFETVEKPVSCIFCAGDQVCWNGQRQRSASVMIGGEVVYLNDILCKRVRCAGSRCKRSWTLRPPGLMPRRHYQLCVVAHGSMRFLSDPRETLTSVSATHSCSRRTVGRWLYWIAGIADPSDLIHRLIHVSKKAVLASHIKVYKIFKRATFHLTINNLCFLEALGMLYGCDPPGFRGMIEKAIANRDRVTTYRCPLIPELAQ